MLVFTIGCSVLSSQEFSDLLKMHSIDVVADVRSIPYSKFTPQFNKETLQHSLKAAGLLYIPMSEEFGARRKEPEAYSNHKVDFQKTIRLPLFQSGISRIEQGLQKGFRIALMCAEKDPLDCHRFILVGRSLEKALGVELLHIHSDGSLENKNSIEKRMLEKLKIAPGLFDDQENTISDAYRRLEQKMGWRKEAEEF